MKTKQLVLLGVVAAGLVGAAMYLSSGTNTNAFAKLNGKSVLPGLSIAKIARIELGDKLVLAAGEEGWKVETFHNYPASHAKLTENLLKLTELKVGQVVRGKAVEPSDLLTLRDAANEPLATLKLGPKHAKWGHGRYAEFAGQTVLVSDSLDAFGPDGKAWVETKIVDTPWISFNDIATDVSAEELGFATGVVAKVTIAGDTNRTVTVGNTVKGGNDRYLKLDNAEWVYIVPGYAVDSLLPKPPEPAESPAAEAKPASESSGASPAAEAKPASESSGDSVPSAVAGP